MGEAEEQPPITNRNLRTQSFRPSDDPIKTGKQWEDWLEEIEREFRFFKITEPTDKKDAVDNLWRTRSRTS